MGSPDVSLLLSSQGAATQRPPTMGTPMAPPEDDSLKTSDWLCRVRVILRLAVYHQSVHLGAKPLGLMARSFSFSFWQLNLDSHRPYETS
jgi:hypothetical protein